jgi:hypothetical protein
MRTRLLPEQSLKLSSASRSNSATISIDLLKYRSKSTHERLPTAT